MSRFDLSGRQAVFPADPPFVLLAAWALLLGAGLGVGSAWFAVGGVYPFGAVKAGQWVMWPKTGSRDIDPYARAIIARSGDLPIGLGEGLALQATRDQEGRPLLAGCSYIVGGVTPPARAWTLTLTDLKRNPVVVPLERSGFTSFEILRDAKDRMRIVLSRRAAEGNWLQMPEGGRVMLVLRLYDTPVSAGSARLDPKSVPSIARIACG